MKLSFIIALVSITCIECTTVSDLSKEEKSISILVDSASYTINDVSLMYHRFIRIDSIERILGTKVTKCKTVNISWDGTGVSQYDTAYLYYFKRYRIVGLSNIERRCLQRFTFFFNCENYDMFSVSKPSKIDLKILGVKIDIKDTFETIKNNEVFKKNIVHSFSNYSITISNQDFTVTFYFNPQNGALCYLNFGI